MRKVLAIITCIGFILGTTHLALSVPPAVDLADYGVALWNSPSGDDLDFWVRVIDHDGNIDNNGDTGAPHQVTVNFPTVYSPNFPDGIDSIILPRIRVENSTTSVYWNALRLGEGYTLPGGNYVFSATDSMGNVGEATDAFTPIPLVPVADSSLSPSNRNQYISAMFDNVFVKRGSQSNWTLYDDFSSGSFDSIARWTHPSGSVYYAGTVTAEAAILPVPNPIGRGRSQLRFKDQPETISGIRADITLSSASLTVPKARIGGYFFKNQNAHIFTEIAVYENRIVCTASEDWNLNGVWWTGAVLFQQEWTNLKFLP